MKDRILELKKFPDDWNGYGASAAKPEAINKALIVADLLTNKPSAVYLDCGDVVMVWEDDAGNSLLLGIDENAEQVGGAFLRTKQQEVK